MKRNIPTRVVETGRLARGSSGQGVGWLQSLSERARNLRAQIVGINERLSTPFSHGVPSAITGEYTFKADLNRTLTIQNFSLNPDAGAPAFFPLLVNPIFLAGQTYRIPITFPPPGVFMAHNLVVGIEAGFNMFANFNRPGITPLNDYRQMDGSTAAIGGGFVVQPSVGTIRWTTQQQVLGDFARVMPFIPYLWNIIDEKSGRQYAQTWMPNGALLNTRGNASGGESDSVLNPDSELFTFDVPWPFERDGQVVFLFRPIMDLYQIDTTDAQLPYGGNPFTGVDDRSGGRRTEEATVHVEFHGNRYYQAQDVLKDGAFVTNSEPRRHPYGLNDPDNQG